MGKIWMVCSGSGGVGKSMIALSLASGAAKAGKRVILLDASGISHSSDLVLGLESIVVLDMIDVAGGQVEIESALYPVTNYPGLRYASASLRDTMSCRELSGIILALHSLCDILVIDLPTGQADLGVGVLRRGDERLVITRADDASIRSCERLIFASGDSEASIGLIVNRLSRERIRRKAQHPRDTVQAVMDHPVIACIHEDPSITVCEQKGRSAIECDGPAWTELKDLLQTLLSTSSE